MSRSCSLSASVWESTLSPFRIVSIHRMVVTPSEFPKDLTPAKMSPSERVRAHQHALREADIAARESRQRRYLEAFAEESWRIRAARNYRKRLAKENRETLRRKVNK